MKFIFLDIDGVLNTAHTKETSPEGYTFVEDIFLRRLANIVEKTGAKIILSSDWRYSKKSADFLAFVEKLRKFGLGIYGFTPEMEGMSWHVSIYDRGDEIDSYLNWFENRFVNETIESYIVLDDRTDFTINEPDKFIHTSPDEGLTIDIMYKAINILNKKQEE